MITGREATASTDAVAISTFACATPNDPQPVHDVQVWAREILAWRDESDDRRVRVYFDDGVLVAIAAYSFLVPNEPHSGYYLALMALAVEYRGKEEQNGMAIALGLIEMLGEEQPGGWLVARVAVRNHGCHKFAVKLKAGEPTSPFDAKGYMEYRITLPGP